MGTVMMKFVVDCMLGKLAKWLKILGFDTVYLNKAEDRDLLLLAWREKRVLLTKDHGLLLAAAGVSCLFIESDSWEEQVAQVLDALRLRKRARPHSRCLACNRALKRIPRALAKNLVTPFVFERAPSFAICPSCGRVFWPGTHFQDMDKKIDRILRAGKRRGRSGPETGKKARRLPKG
jgi:uncharacterized protein with PIN domain